MAAAVALPLALGAARSWASEPAGDVAYGEYLATECVTCHLPTGASNGGIPPIVGLSPSTFVDALLSYKDGQRDNQVMRNVTSVLGVEEIAALAAYFATLSPD